MYMQANDGHVFTTNVPEYHKDAKQLTLSKGRELLKDQSIKKLRTMICPGDTVYTVLRHVSSSGMNRRIDVYIMQNNVPLCITGHVSNITGWKVSDKGGLMVGGCGMDMGFHTVYTLSHYIFWDEAEKTDAGYYVKHEWI